ncbi:hypothetical protein [Laceyella putida]|uniref:Serine/threonine protein kinase n=1 Tax=Laceyella putida TaxID=110101 RepID=A0ABW2RIU3_9BACL
MKQETNMKRRYYERFQVEDVINFFSGQLLQAKSADGAQVFLQSIKITRRPLPNGYEEAFRRLQHPYLAPILDIIEEENELLLVHPPFAGDPLPLVVNKERAMDPEVAVRIVGKCFKTLRDLERLPLPLSATLDPKNILLNGHKPLILFYFMKDPKTPRYDEKWRELLFYLLTGQTPVGGIKQCETVLERKKIPSRIAKLALMSLDRKQPYVDVLQAVEGYIDSKGDIQGSGLSRKNAASKKTKRKGVVTTVTIAAAALVLVTLAVSQWQPEDSYTGIFENPDNAVGQQGGEQIDTGGSLVQSIHFSNDKTQFALPYTLTGDSNLRGEFELAKLNGFYGYLESSDGKAQYGIYINKQGSIELYHTLGSKMTKVGVSGDGYKIKPGKKYTFEILYYPNEPIRMAFSEEGQPEKWVATGITPVSGELKLRFSGKEGAVLYYPEPNPVTDKQMVERVWMNQQPWHIDFGQAVLTLDEQQRSRLKVFPASQIRLGANDTSKFSFIPATQDDVFQIDIQTINSVRYRLVLEGKEKKVSLFKLEEKIEKVAEKPLDWKSVDDVPYAVTIKPSFTTLTIDLSRGTNKTTLEHTDQSPVLLKDVTLQNRNGFQLVEEKENIQEELQ